MALGHHSHVSLLLPVPHPCFPKSYSQIHNDRPEKKVTSIAGSKCLTFSAIYEPASSERQWWFSAFVGYDSLWLIVLDLALSTIDLWPLSKVLLILNSWENEPYTEEIKMLSDTFESDK